MSDQLSLVFHFFINLILYFLKIIDTCYKNSYSHTHTVVLEKYFLRITIFSCIPNKRKIHAQLCHFVTLEINRKDMLFTKKILVLEIHLKNQFSSVQFSRSVMSDSLQPHESQHSWPPCPSPTPRVHSDSRPSSQ